MALKYGNYSEQKALTTGNGFLRKHSSCSSVENNLSHQNFKKRNSKYQRINIFSENQQQTEEYEYLTNKKCITEQQEQKFADNETIQYDYYQTIQQQNPPMYSNRNLQSGTMQTHKIKNFQSPNKTTRNIKETQNSPLKFFSSARNINDQNNNQMYQTLDTEQSENNNKNQKKQYYNDLKSIPYFSFYKLNKDQTGNQNKSSQQNSQTKFNQTFSSFNPQITQNQTQPIKSALKKSQNQIVDKENEKQSELQQRQEKKQKIQGYIKKLQRLSFSKSNRSSFTKDLEEKHSSSSDTDQNIQMVPKRNYLMPSFNVKDMKKQSTLQNVRQSKIGEIFFEEVKEKPKTILNDYYIEKQSNKIILDKNSFQYDRNLQKAIKIKEESVSNTFKKILPYVQKSQKFSVKKKLSGQQLGLEILLFLQKLLDHNLTIKDFVNNKVISTKAFEKPEGKEFFQAIKDQDLKRIKAIYQQNKFVLYDIDHSGMTPLIVASKRGDIDTVLLLLKLGSFIDAEDFLGRTALYFSLMNKNIPLFKALLYNKASPWNSNHSYDSLCDQQENESVKQVLITARKIHIVLKLIPVKMQKKVFEEQTAFMQVYI